MNVQFTYIQLPLFLFNDARYNKISVHAKILYALILNRMKLSKQNKELFSDEVGIFVYFSNSTIKEYLNCDKNKATKALVELETVGLIKKAYRRGLPLKIYINDTKIFSEKVHSPATRNVSFDTEKAEIKARENRKNFGTKKNKRRTRSSGPTL